MPWSSQTADNIVIVAVLLLTMYRKCGGYIGQSPMYFLICSILNENVPKATEELRSKIETKLRTFRHP